MTTANPSTPEVTRALKPCPFCGAEAIYAKTEWGSSVVGCLTQNCPAEKGCYDFVNDESAAALWNTRTPARGGDELREALVPVGEALGFLIKFIGPTREDGSARLAGMLDRDQVQSVLAAANLAALASTDMADAGLFDRQPQVSSPEYGSEPCLRRMVRFYYDQHGQDDPDADTEAYIAALSAAPQVEGLTSGEGWQLVPVGEPVTLNECPPGPFAFKGSLGFKTEYGAMSGKDAGAGKVDWTVTHWPDPYCLDSGEAFWGGVSGQEARAALTVQPLAASPKATATASVRGFDLDDGEWFYPEGDHSSDECRHSADEVIDYALEGGAKSQVVCIERATSLPAVYAAVRVFTDAEKDERNSDDDYAYTLFATAEEARAALQDSGTAATIGGERA